ncbi:MAG: signal peptidase I [Firmicutes bacterium]|nr:signal peptidase I [Bacillota bacterium]
MNTKKDETHYNFKGLFKYISTVVSWTMFVLLVIIGALLIYYYISVRLYATKGEKYEPKFSVYTIVSGSMEPTISVYDVIINTKLNDINEIKQGDVITFISTWSVTQGMTITHRVIGSKTLDDGSTCLITRGDNNTQEDETCVTEKNIIGVTKAVIPGLGKIQFFLASKLGWLLLIVVPALYIIIKEIFKIFKLSKEVKVEDENKKIKSKNPKLEEAYKDLLKVKGQK